MAKTKTNPTPTKNEAEKPKFLAENSVITITIPWKEVAPAFTKATNKLAKQVNLPGFRKGKVPSKIAQETIKPDHLIEHTLEEIIPERYTNKIKEENKRPISYPEFNPVAVEQGEDWIIEAQFAERPTVNIKDYEKTVKSAKKESEKIVKDIEKNAEAKKDLPASPDGKDPAAELKEQAEQARLEHIYRSLITTFQPSVPEILLKQEVRQELRQLAQQLSGMKLTIEDYLKQRGMEFEQLSQEVTVNVLGRLQLGFILEAVVEAKKLTVSDKEIEDYIETAVAPAMRDQYKSNQQYKSSIYQTLLRKKIADHLLAL